MGRTIYYAACVILITMCAYNALFTCHTKGEKNTMNTELEKDNKTTCQAVCSTDLLSAGDWRLMKYGLGTFEWYVLRIKGDRVQIGQRRWLVSSSMWMDKKEFLRKSKPIGKGKFRLWWYILPWRDLVVPFSTYR